MRLQLLGLAVGMGTAWPASAATPDGAIADCTRPASATEQAICADPVLVAADRALAALAAELRQRLPDGVAATQRDWLRRRDRMCAPEITVDCLRVAYAERDAYLRSQIAVAPPAAPAAPPSVEPMPQRPSQSPAPETGPAAFASRISTAPCQAVSSGALRVMGWSAGQSPFGLPVEQWSKTDFAALIRRAEDCQAANMDNPRNLQAMTGILNQLRGVAPERPATLSAPSPTADLRPASSQSQPQPQAQPQLDQDETRSLDLDCADPALLQDVTFTYQSMPGGGRVRRLDNPRPYTDVIMQAYSSSPALQAEYRRLRPYMAPVPQCLVNAETSQGSIVLSYRLYRESGRTLVEVQRVP
jgi:uncharacterized protein